MSEPTSSHNPEVQPGARLNAALRELAFEIDLTPERRQETFANGERALQELVRQLAEARAWARGYEHRLFPFDTTNAPQWLIAPLDAEGR